MLKTLLLTDLHITDPGELIIGLDPFKRLKQVVEHAVSTHPTAQRMVLMGDLTHHGKPSEYARLKTLLDTVPMPITLTMGNHDLRDGLAEGLGAHHFMDGFAHQAWEEDETLFLLLDTADEEGKAPRHGGWLCDARLSWVADQLAASDAKRIVCMMHHPPYVTGIPAVDGIRLMNGDALYEVLSHAKAPVHVICGHVHRTISGMAHGLPFSTLKSTCHQMPMELEDASTGLSVDEPGAYGVLLTGPDGIIVHSEDVFDTPRPVAVDAASE